nr:c-type cytochrome domain-containing protein [Verrucomicrobiae bacterium]
MKALLKTRSLGAALGALMMGAVFAPRAIATDISKLPPPAGRPVDFTKDIEPLLADRCYSCHGEKKQESGLRLDVRDMALKGGEHGALLVAGKSAESLIV